MTEKFYMPVSDATPRDHADVVGYIVFEGIGSVRHHLPVYGVRSVGTIDDALLNIEGMWCWVPTNALIHMYPALEKEAGRG